MSTTKTSPILQTSLCYDGRCEEAIEFYRQALGAEVIMLFRFKDSPEPLPPDCAAPGIENKIMHARIKIGETVLIVSDGRCAGSPVFQGFTLSLVVPTAAEVERIFAALAEGGKAQMPLAKTFFSELFGMVADRFGVSWMVMVTPTGS